MSYVEIGAKELSRMLSIMSAYFGVVKKCQKMILIYERN